MQELGETIGHECRGDRHQSVAGLGQSGVGGNVEGEPPKQPADQPAATKIAASLAQKAAVLANPGSGPNPGNGDTAQGAVGKS